MVELLALPTSDHGVSGSSPSGGEIISKPKRRFIAQSFSCSPLHCFDMNTVESDVKPQLIHPSIESYSKDDLSVYSVAKYSRAR